MDQIFSSYSTYLLAKKRTRSCARSMSGFEKGQGEDEQYFNPETFPHRVPFTGMMNEIPTSSKEPKGGNAIFLPNAERNSVYFRQFKPGYFMYIGAASEKTWHFEEYPDDPKGKRDELARQVKEVCILYRSIHS